MKLVTNFRQNHSRIVNQEKFEERETWHKLVVKVILWKGESSIDSPRKLVDKITTKEWRTYCRRTVKINIVLGRKIVSANLKELWKVISKNKGFEDLES
ncbi:hypothetical protein HY025_01995 [Candidatus Daviesbacteria bacterium]|nr:hypothetical protein [Candidatus Daviesbacteria bacterium]